MMIEWRLYTFVSCSSVDKITDYSRKADITYLDVNVEESLAGGEQMLEHLASRTCPSKLAPSVRSFPDDVMARHSSEML